MSNDESDRGPGDPSRLPQTQPAGVGRPADEGVTASGEGEPPRGLQQAFREDLDEAWKFADEQAQQVKAAVSRTAEDQKNVLARQLSGVATALEKVGSELEQSEQRDLGRYARQIGRSLQGYARDVEERKLGEIAGKVEDFGRRQPLAFLGLAAIAGLATSRLLTASAERRDRQGGVGKPSAQTPHAGAGFQNSKEVHHSG